MTNSDGWVFSGWIGFSQWIKKEYGDYPKREMLVELRRMSKEEREEHTWFGVYLWEKKRGGESNEVAAVIIVIVCMGGFIYSN